MQIDEEKIYNILGGTKKSDPKTIFSKARDLKGLSLDDVGVLLNLTDSEHIQALFDTARWIKGQIYGERLVFFAPLYVSDFCVNDCEYCNFHIRNKMTRKKLTLDEVEQQTRFLINMGHKRILVESGEDPVDNNIDYVVEVINKIYSVREKKGNIRRVNVNISATTTENYSRLKEAKIGTYQLFQETYHHQTYKKLHRGPKADYVRQITAHERAFKAGIDDLGLGVLFGLYDWRFEVLALVSHAQYLDRKFNVGPHTISVPRFRPGSTITYTPEYPVSDQDFLKLIAILRLAVPYTGLIISTREKPWVRKIAFQIGISQTSAGSVTSVGGYGKKKEDHSQFHINDERPLSEVVSDILQDNLLPSFCTACYRIGRTGEDFMKLAKPGEIHTFCRPNGLLTFAEYLEDFCSDGLYEKGQKVIDHYLDRIENDTLRKLTKQKLQMIKQGHRDLYF